MYKTYAQLGGSERRRQNSTARAEAGVRAETIARPAPAQNFWSIDAARVLRWLRRGAPLVVVVALTVAALGVGYSLVTPPRFTAQTEIVIDPSNLQVVPDDIYGQSQQRDSQLLEVESMLGVLTSGNSLGRVVSKLDLASDPEFVKPAGFSLGSLLGGSSAPASSRPADVVALETLDGRIKAVRKDGSFIVTVSAWTGDAEKSVTVVNAVVEAFKAELAQEEADGARRSVSSLSEQLTQLKQNVAEAEDAVEAFKRTHSLQQTNGELTSAQSMTQLNAQVTDAQTRLIAAQSRYDSLTRTGLTGASTDALQSATMTALRTQYATLQQQYNSAAATLGKRHPTMLELARQMQGAEDQIKQEIDRTVAAAKSEVDAAKAALDAMTAQTSEARGSVATDDQAQVELRALQREADSRAAVYQAYLSRADQLAQRQAINTTNVRVISPAVLPIRSWPPGPALAGIAGIVAGTMLGLLLAAGLGLWSDYRKLSATTRK